MGLQVYVYKLPSLPGATRGYAATNAPLKPPNNQSPFFGSAGLAATEGAEYIYVASPVAPQPSSQLLNLYGNASVFVYAVRPDLDPSLWMPCSACGRMYIQIDTWRRAHPAFERVAMSWQGPEADALGGCADERAERVEPESDHFVSIGAQRCGLWPQGKL